MHRNIEYVFKLQEVSGTFELDGIQILVADLQFLHCLQEICYEA